MYTQLERREFIHRIDAAGRICFINRPWREFASENGWEMGTSQVLGTELMGSITDPQTRHLYALLMDRIRQSGRKARFGYRCDSADMRRLMEMQVRYDERSRQFEFRSRVLCMERREPMALLDMRRPRQSEDTLSVCSWCKSVLAGQVWIEVEQAVRKRRLFALDALPRITHGICPDCSKRISALAHSL